jgi:hypothetical protein
MHAVAQLLVQLQELAQLDHVGIMIAISVHSIALRTQQT